MNQVQFHDGRHYLRPYRNVLWVLDDKDSISMRRVFNQELCSVKDFAMNSSEIETFRTQVEVFRTKEEMRNKKLESIRAPLAGAKQVDFSRHEARAVLQGEYAVAGSGAKQPVTGTWGAWPCLIMALYDSKNRMALIAHIDASTDIDSLPLTLSGFSGEHTVAHLYGGNLMSTGMCMDVVDFLEREKIKIENADIVRSGLEPASLAIDARNGQIYTPCRRTDFTDDPSLKDRFEIYSVSGFFVRPFTLI